MIKINEVGTIPWEELENGSTILAEMVQEYCNKSGYNFCKELDVAFAYDSKTVIIIQERDGQYYPIGFACGTYIKSSDQFFLEQGFLVKPVDRPDLLMDNIYNTLCEVFEAKPSKIVLHSDLPGRLWTRYGFKESPVKIYEREMGGCDGK